MNKMPGNHVASEVRAALREDLGARPERVERWIPTGSGRAKIICRQQAVICGSAWCDASFRKLDGKMICRWKVPDGTMVKPNSCVAEISGSLRALLLGERTALNFLQLLSGIATSTAKYAQAAGSVVKVTDTRKTIPSLRLSQKYAVRCGGGNNHRMGLYDAVLLKENHIHACGGLTKALSLASRSAAQPPMLEVENIEQLRQALALGIGFVLLDNFSLRQLRQAVRINDGKAILEASGNISLKNIAKVAATGVDRIAVGRLTKDVESVDFSLLHC